MQGFGITPHHQLWVWDWWAHYPSPRRLPCSCACVSVKGYKRWKKHTLMKQREREKKNIHVPKCINSTSLGRPPGFNAMALTNSGETQRTGERTAASGEEPSSGPFWYWPSLVMRRRGRVAGSSKVIARAWTPEMMCKWVLKFSKGWSKELCQFHHCHQRLMVVSHCECSPRSSPGAFNRQSNTAKHLQEAVVVHLQNLTCTHKVNAGLAADQTAAQKHILKCGFSMNDICNTTHTHTHPKTLATVSNCGQR